jgi:hypothetical protein
VARTKEAIPEIREMREPTAKEMAAAAPSSVRKKRSRKEMRMSTRQKAYSNMTNESAA